MSQEQDSDATLSQDLVAPAPSYIPIVVACLSQWESTSIERERILVLCLGQIGESCSSDSKTVWTEMMFDAISLYLLLMSHCHSFQTYLTLHLSKFSTGAGVLNQFQSDWEENTLREDLFVDLLRLMRRSILGWWRLRFVSIRCRSRWDRIFNSIVNRTMWKKSG